MREIKFRAWDEQNKIMHNEVEFIRSGTEKNDWILFKSDKQKLEHGNVLNNPYFQQQIKVMQYTGLKDKNGKEIYENDIVRLYEWEHMFEYTDRKVVFFQGCFKVEDINDGYFCNIDLVNLSLCEVVSNIYENPKLLKEDK